MIQAFEYSWNHWFTIPATAIISFFLLGIEELGIQLEEPFRYVGSRQHSVFLRATSLILFTHFCVSSVLPQHKITNGIGLSAEEHVEWMLKDDTNYRAGRVNAVNAALGKTDVQEMVDEYMYVAK